MKFVLSTTVSRMRRQKARLAFVALAIAASSCLIVWTIGGFQALFIDATTEEADYLGTCDVKIAAKDDGATERRGGGTFSGPLKITRPAPDTKSEEAAQAKTKESVEKKDVKSDGFAQKGKGRRGRNGGRRGVDGGAFSPELIAELRADEG
ncbi:MAG: hypothetical protein IJO46_07395, partial [Thermoguttaceae bacterium]|nr:hypothetical protein [Thermoguttaceae bacterium]